jgi:hypothetical protein
MNLINAVFCVVYLDYTSELSFRFSALCYASFELILTKRLGSPYLCNGLRYGPLVDCRIYIQNRLSCYKFILQLKTSEATVEGGPFANSHV